MPPEVVWERCAETEDGVNIPNKAELRYDLFDAHE